MKAAAIKENYLATLAGVYTKREAESLFFIMLRHSAGFTRIDYLSKAELEVEPAEAEKMLAALQRLKAGEPYQHITGEVEFCGLRLKVSPQALIPRPETEELVMEIKGDFGSREPLHILDIGTGTGCIALALASFFPQAEVYAVDVSETALALARHNARQLGLKVDFQLLDILKPAEFGKEDFDLIVSNPPYIALSESQRMEATVTRHEPASALFAPDEDPLVFYKAIEKFSRKHLKKGGRLYLEINERLGAETLALYRERGFDAVLKKDLSGKERFVMATK